MCGPLDELRDAAPFAGCPVHGRRRARRDDLSLDQARDFELLQRANDVKVEDWHQVGDMVRLSTFYDLDGTPWMLAQTLDEDKRSRR